MPQIAAQKRVGLAEQARVLKDSFFLGNIALSVVVFTAMSTAYTYLADTLQHVAMMPASQIGGWLMGFGVLGLFGNWIGGKLVERGPLFATAIATLVLGVGMAAIAPFAPSHSWLVLALAAWVLPTRLSIRSARCG